MRQTEHQFDFWHHKHQRTQKGLFAILLSQIDPSIVKRELYVIAQIPTMILFFGLAFQDAPIYIVARTMLCYAITRSSFAAIDRNNKERHQELELSKEFYERK